MAITFDDGIFHLQSKNCSYVIWLTPEKDLMHLYWGRRLRRGNLAHIYRPPLSGGSPRTHQDPNMAYETMPMEYPFFGSGDFRIPAFRLRMPDGSKVCEPRYVTHRIIAGKPALKGLPATYADDEGEAQTLEIELRDGDIKLILSYTAFDGYDAFARSARLENVGDSTIVIEQAMSASVDFSHSNFKMLHLSGAWARERSIHSRRLEPGLQGIDSRRGASSHQQNPFIALLAPDATEDHGDAYGFSLVYSGNFLAQVEVDQFFNTRLTMGINPFDFAWQLNPGDSFQTPEILLGFSDVGLGGLSRAYHDIIRERLCRGRYRDEIRPVLINNWEMTYFDFDEQRLVKIAEDAKELGIELLVLDDGWFGRRNDDTSSLGDWQVNHAKLPGGLKGLAGKINAAGVKFGLWVEPEMISPDSELYRQHPDWCLHVPGRRRTEARNQLVLDLSRDEIADWLMDTLKSVFSSAPIEYVKWDMNRNMTELFSVAYAAGQQGEISHRYMLNLYRLLDELIKSFPNILFEGCAAGGGRFDPGVLHYMPQIWTSDNTDAVERLKIQYGTSIVYPVSAICAQVSDVPNHQLGRSTSIAMRLNCAMSANMGFSINLDRQSEDDRQQIRAGIERYKQMRSLIQFGDFYRIWNPFEDNCTAWQFVAKDKRRCALFFGRTRADVQMLPRIIRLKGLDPMRDYRLAEYDIIYEAFGYHEIYPGDALMTAGLRLTPLAGDFQSNLISFEAV